MSFPLVGGVPICGAETVGIVGVGIAGAAGGVAPPAPELPPFGARVAALICSWSSYVVALLASIVPSAWVIASANELYPVIAAQRACSVSLTATDTGSAAGAETVTPLDALVDDGAVLTFAAV